MNICAPNAFALAFLEYLHWSLDSLIVISDLFYYVIIATIPVLYLTIKIMSYSDHAMLFYTT